MKALLAWGALVAALLIGFLASQPPVAQPASAPPTEFSAERAMPDVREMSREPRPTNSAANARVRAYLLARMRALGMIAGTQEGPLPPKSIERLRWWGDHRAAEGRIVNLVGVFPGRDRGKPAVLLMAHHDSVWASPGAPDDAAGTAAGLEIVRAIAARGQPERDIILLLTDAEELGLDGARLFFGTRWAGRVGAVINMEARGGGGRAAMFETGRGNGRWMDVYREHVARPSSNSLAVLIYGSMPNDTDFTIPKKQGFGGFNFAFIGRPELYHSPLATADRLDRGALQDLGAQSLGVASALAFAPELPARADDAVFGDVLGLFVIAYPPAIGWLILGLAAALFAFAWVRVGRAGAITATDLAGGTAIALSLVLHLALLLRVLNLLSGAGRGSNYYDRLAAIPRLELQAFFLALALLLAACIAVRPAQRSLAAAPALGLAALGLLIGGWSTLTAGLGIAAAGLAMLPPRQSPSVWGGWFGFALPVAALSLAVQIAAPTAGPLLMWPLLLAGIAAAAAAILDPATERWQGLVAPALATVIGAGHLFYLAHFTFLGVGAPLPEPMALYALLVALLAWPLIRSVADRRWFGAAAALLLIAAIGLSLSVRLDPMAATIPPYSDKR